MSEDNNISSLWEHYFQHRDEDSRNRLMEHYLNLVKYAVDRIVKKLPSGVDSDELIQAGIWGLRDAVESYDPQESRKFETFCMPIIRAKFYEKIRNNLKI